MPVWFVALYCRVECAVASRPRSQAGSPVPAAAVTTLPHGTVAGGACHTQQGQPSTANAIFADKLLLSAGMEEVVDSVDSKDSSRKLKRQLMMSGLITAVGIALHNFPEGVAVFLAAQKSHAIGEATECLDMMQALLSPICRQTCLTFHSS